MLCTRAGVLVIGEDVGCVDAGGLRFRVVICQGRSMIVFG